ncbi:MAG: aspartyl protease [Deltaproteobacteria bacterium]|nr:aspartyl protease [Deltaproteobacteria bacterium]
MGITFLKLRVVNPARLRTGEELEFLVDTGAIYSVVPGRVLRRLGIKPDRTEEFTLADGSHTKRRIGGAVFEIDGRRGPSPVIFGESDDAILLGSVTLEALGLMVDPLKRQLRPLPMLLV